MFFITTTIEGKITGRILDQETTREAADRAVERIVSLGTYTRPGEAVVIYEAASRRAVPREIERSPVMTDDMQRARILGDNSVMNRDT